MPRSRRPLGAVLSGAAAVVAAVPTLFFPADSPTEPKLALVGVGAVVFIAAIVRIRAEGAGSGATSASDDVSGTEQPPAPRR